MASTERERGNRWADYWRERACWVQKVGASELLAGFPDWIVAAPEGLRVVEAKVALDEGPSVAVPSMFTRAQRFVLEAVARYAPGAATVLILGPEAWAEFQVRGRIGRIGRKQFELAAVRYDWNV